MSQEIRDNFDFAVEQVRNSKPVANGPSNEEKLKFYAYYKQAVIGKCNTQQPSMLNMTERAKWNAWNSLGSMDKETAMLKYCDLYLQVSTRK